MTLSAAVFPSRRIPMVERGRSGEPGKRGEPGRGNVGGAGGAGGTGGAAGTRGTGGSGGTGGRGGASAARKRRRFDAIQTLSALVSVAALIVVVVLSLNTSDALKNQGDRSCDVANSNLNTNIALRKVQNAAARHAISASDAYIGATHRLLVPFARTARRGGPSAPLSRLIIPYLQAGIAVRIQSNSAEQATLSASAGAIREWRRLKGVLRC